MVAPGVVSVPLLYHHLRLPRQEVGRASGRSGGADKNSTDKNGADKPNGDKNNSDDASPSPSVVGLCHAYAAGAGADHGKALENPAFTVLITAAGGKDQVSAYCSDLLAKQSGEAAHPMGNPSTRPNGPGEEHPTGKSNGTPPSTHPSH